MTLRALSREGVDVVVGRRGVVFIVVGRRGLVLIVELVLVGVVTFTAVANAGDADAVQEATRMIVLRHSRRVRGGNWGAREEHTPSKKSMR